MRERLRIGEVARLVGVTPKTVRYYEKIGLLEKLERSEAGYRLYTADDLLRLHRIKRLRSFGLSLERIKSVLGEPESGNELRSVLETLLGEIEGQIGMLEERRGRLRELLSKEDPEAPDETPRVFALAEEHLGEHLEDVSPSAIEQTKRLWATIEAFEWPKGYTETMEALVRYYVDHPEEYRAMLELEERIAALAEVPEDSSEVERLVEDYIRHLETNPFPEWPTEGPAWTTEPLGGVFFELMTTSMSPAQQRFFELFGERLSALEEGGTR